MTYSDTILRCADCGGELRMMSIPRGSLRLGHVGSPANPHFPRLSRVAADRRTVSAPDGPQAFEDTESAATRGAEEAVAGATDPSLARTPTSLRDLPTASGDDAVRPALPLDLAPSSPLAAARRST